MNDYEAKVRDFHLAVNAAIDTKFSVDLLSLRKKLLAEEMAELFEEIDNALGALQQGEEVGKTTLTKLLKEMADVQYVLSGMAVTFGLPIDQAFARVHESNLSKLDDSGKPVVREDGKIMKGPRYHPPHLDDLAVHQD